MSGQLYFLGCLDLKVRSFTLKKCPREGLIEI
jgi:hypothetical protein